MQTTTKTKVLSAVLAAVLLLTGIFSVNVFAADEAIAPKEAQNGVLSYLLTAVPEPTLSSVGGEWCILALARAQYKVPDAYYENYKARVLEILKENDGVLPGSSSKKTEYARLILALTALGTDVTSFGGYNLLLPLANFDDVIYQGINGPVYALLALDSNAWEIPEIEDADKQTTRERLVNYILDKSLPNGGWALFGSSIDPDITGMALQALAPYKEEATVKAHIESALAALSAVQAENGGFTSWGTQNAESIAQIVTALSVLGIDAAKDERFAKENGNPVSALLDFRQADGSFHHTMDGMGVNLMATEQAAYALVAYNRFVSGENSLYDMRDAFKAPEVPTEPEAPTEPIDPPAPDDEPEEVEIPKTGALFA